MKHPLSFLVLMLSACLSFSAFAGSSDTTKAGREDFNSMIQDGLDLQQELRGELRSNAGLPRSERAWTDDANEQGRRLAGIHESEERVSPTTEFADQ